MPPPTPSAVSLSSSLLLKTPLTKDSAKELSRSFRWMKAFNSCKRVGMSPLGMTQEEKLSRYTNFSLEHIYEKYRGMQTHLMVRESVLFCSAHGNPEILDPHLPRMQSVWLDTKTTHEGGKAALGVLEVLEGGAGTTATTKTTTPTSGR
eukprot:GHVS01036505.1.p1 GENE.GHVS01036505.1~~GHVS01036505.1.p1  ORF type:complete len:149 (+),score=32.41 GHVS01036505.1:246-692(+)